MIFLPVAFALLVHAWFWGAGLSTFVMPRPWRRFWPVLVLPAGFALQLLVGGLGSMVVKGGPGAYAWSAELLPTALLIAALHRRGPRVWLVDVMRFGLIWASAGAVLVLLCVPLMFASSELATVSLASSSIHATAGGMPLTTWSDVGRWPATGGAAGLRMLAAFNGAILGCAPATLVTVLGAVLLAAAVPSVFWLARAVMYYSAVVSLGIGLLFGVNPIPWCAFAHGGGSQLLAALGVALLTWTGIALWRMRLTVRRAGWMQPVLALGCSLLLGSQTPLAAACCTPVLVYAGSAAVWRGQFARFSRWFGAMLMPLVVCALVLGGRIGERAGQARLPKANDTGWNIRLLTLEGWLGMVRGPDLEAWTFLGLRWLLMAAVLSALCLAFARAIRNRRQNAWIAACLALPILAAYVYLEVHNARTGLGSPSAFNLMVISYPEVLMGLCWWVTLRRSGRILEWIAVVAFATMVMAFNIAGTGMMIWSLAHGTATTAAEISAAP